MDTEPIGEAAVRAALSEVLYPGLRRDIVALGLVRGVQVHNGRVHVSLVLGGAREEVPELLREAIRARLARAGAVRTEVQIRPPERMASAARDPWAERALVPNVAHVVAVGSGKGGVGKSTVAVNLALALRELGLRVGVLDADIYGPSVPLMLGLEDGAKRIRMSAEKKIEPLEAHGLAVVSFGFFLGPESPAVWRGPMVSKAVKQFSRGVLWPALDVLVVDLPPGTGDVPLSLAQAVEVDGGVVVTTPQRLSVQEAEKAVEMFRKLDVPVLGVVENMSHARCDCGRLSYPFGRGGGAALAERQRVPLLGEFPFEEPALAEGDHGRPPLISAPESAVSHAVRAVAARVAWALASTQNQSDARTTSPAAPGPA